MKACLIYWILGASLLTACSSQPTTLPNCDVPSPMAEVGLPVSVPEMPSPVRATEEEATFDKAGVVVLTQVRIAAETNKTVAQENAAAITARNAEVNALIECTQGLNVWMEVKEQDLEQERRDHFIDNLWHRGVIVLGLIAVAL